MGEEALLLSPEDEVFKEKCNCAMKVQFGASLKP